MVTKITPTTHPIPVEAPTWFKRWALQDRATWKRSEPQAPEKLFAAATTELPDPALANRTIAFDTTLNKAVISDGIIWNPLW